MTQRIGEKRHKLSERGNDLYQTDPVAVEALLRCETIPDGIWEPACGPGAIVRTLRAHGLTVFASDLVGYPGPSQDAHGQDFLMERAMPEGMAVIFTNPPYKLADEFVRHALELCPFVVMLLRFAFLEGTTRGALLGDTGEFPCPRVHLFKNRLPMMHREGWAGPRTTSMQAFAWFVWDRSHKGGVTVNRIRWEA